VDFGNFVVCYVCHIPQSFNSEISESIYDTNVILGLIVNKSMHTLDSCFKSSLMFTSLSLEASKFVLGFV
jgi:hypothetical protein